MKLRQVSRERELNVLLEIIEKKEIYQESSKDGLVILLNGEWGTGKTTFINELKAKIEKDSQKEIFNIYNAFEHDFYDEAYTPFFTNLEEKIKVEKEFREFSKVLGKELFSDFISLIINIAKNYCKNKTGIDLEKVQSDIEKFEDSKCDNYTEKYKAYLLLKRKIKERVEKKSKNKELIFVIDELDRCKPSFAIETLEIVKHFFDLKNCVFIIAVDKIQLEESVKIIHGSNLNAEKYFSKFFDYQFNLLPLDFKELVSESNVHEAKIITKASKMFEILNISTRESKKIINDFLVNISNRNEFSNNFLLFLFTLKYTDLLFYKEILSCNYNYYRKLIISDSYNEYSKYKEILNMNVSTNKTYDEILQEISLVLNKYYYEMNNYNSNNNTVTMINSKTINNEELWYDIERYTNPIDENLTIKENIERIIN